MHALTLSIVPKIKKKAERALARLQTLNVTSDAKKANSHTNFGRSLPSTWFMFAQQWCRTFVYTHRIRMRNFHFVSLDHQTVYCCEDEWQVPLSCALCDIQALYSVSGNVFIFPNKYVTSLRSLSHSWAVSVNSATLHIWLRGCYCSW